MIRRCLSVTGALLTLLLAAPTPAAVISVGAYTVSATSPFVVPILVSGAIDLDAFTFDVVYNPLDFLINTSCDPFSGDAYCDLVTGPITQGTFYTAASADPQLFNPGFVLLGTSGAQIGRLLATNGAWQGAGPGPSGDGILAYVEFVAVAGGSTSSPIAVPGAPPATVPEPGSLALMAGACVLMFRRRRERRQRTPRRGVLNAMTSCTPMNTAALRWAAIVGTCMALLASGVQAQTTASGPYYATPSWDQTIPVASRYVVLANFNSDAVLDRETGLVWQRTQPPAYYQWIPAYRFCMNLKLGNRRGWRLPTAAEMFSLFDATTLAAPGLPPGHPFIGVNPTANGFWTSTLDRTVGQYHEIAYLAGVYEPHADLKFGDKDSHVLCVRSAAPQGGLPD